MVISIINIARDAFKFTSVGFLGAILSSLVTLYVATILVPEEYGVYGYLALWLMYAGLIGPGIISAGLREMPVYLGQGKEEEALRLQNISITSELLFSIIPFIVILGASFFYSQSILKFGLIVIAVSYIVTRSVNYWSQVNFIREKFNLVARGNLISAIVIPALTAASVYWLRVYAIIIAPVISAVILGIYYWKKGQIDYHFTFNRAETVRLTKVGVVLQAVTLAGWGFRMADRTIIAAMLPFEQLGLYTYAVGFIMTVLLIFINFGRVLQPILWRESGKAGDIFEGFKDSKRLAVYMALGAAIVIPLAQIGFFLVVTLITNKYIGSVPVFYILSYNIYLASVSLIPSLILSSSIVNKQKIMLYFHSIGLALNIIFDIFVIKLGYGLVGVTVVTICTQGLVSFILYYFIKGYIFRDTKNFHIFLARIIAPFLVAIPFYFFHTRFISVAPNLWVFVGASLVAQLLIWSLLIWIFYRDYLSITDIKMLVKEIKMIVTRR
jgi:O-antigen/teichoic acid export membrane protein